MLEELEEDKLHMIAAYLVEQIPEAHRDSTLPEGNPRLYLDRQEASPPAALGSVSLN